MALLPVRERSPRRRARAAGGMAAVLLAAVAVGGCAADVGPRSATGAVRQLAPGVNIVDAADRRPLPEVAGESVDGRPLRLAAVAGHPMVVNFWASWCGPCRREQTALQRASQELGAEGVAFIGVNVRDDRANAAAYLHDYGVTYPSLFDHASLVPARLGRDQPESPPSTLIVDSSGRIAARIYGALNGGRGSVTDQVNALLAVLQRIER